MRHFSRLREVVDVDRFCINGYRVFMNFSSSSLVQVQMLVIIYFEENCLYTYIMIVFKFLNVACIQSAYIDLSQQYSSEYTDQNQSNICSIQRENSI
jgi:hypothetical protein